MRTTRRMERLLAGLELPAQHRELLRERFDGALDCCRAGEHAVALECVLSNLHEFDVPVSSDAHAFLGQLAVRYRIGEDYASLLSELQISADLDDSLRRDLEALGHRRETAWRWWVYGLLFAVPVAGLLPVERTARGWLGTAVLVLIGLVVIAFWLRYEARAWREIEDCFDRRDAERDGD